MTDTAATRVRAGPRMERHDDCRSSSLLSALPGLLAATAVAMTAPIFAADKPVDLPTGIATVDDGRGSIDELFAAFNSLVEEDWAVDVIIESQPPGTEHPVPVVALRTAASGPAMWIIAGIHGEEPAGPNAIANVIAEIAEAGKRRPLVVIPLANPQGYVRNWRYLNTPEWAEDVDAQSVGDSSHMLPDPDKVTAPRAPAASSAEAGALTRYIARLIRQYPPLISLDLHEDNEIDAGYVYSQGNDGADEPYAHAAVRVLQASAIPIQLDGQTRFEEPIVDGIIGPVTDSSIDELMSAPIIYVDGEMQDGPASPVVLVFETPSANLALDRRVRAHEAVLRRMLQLYLDGDD